ncbi:MAG: pilus assembly protein [Comamonas sp.]|nr:pilus assembly protein [Comamonas sp.]
MIEFALALIVFLMFLFGILDFSRMLFTWAAANEAARAGARYAAVCDDTTHQAQVLSHMQALLPQISAINTSWAPSGCNSATCQSVTVTITGLQFQWISPIAGSGPLAAISMPNFATFATTLPREVMRQDPNSSTACAS